MIKLVSYMILSDKIRIIFTALTEKVCGKIIYTSLIYSAKDDSS